MDRCLLLKLVACFLVVGRPALAQELRTDARPDMHPRPAIPVVTGSDYPRTRLVRVEFLGSGPRHGFYGVESICLVPCRAELTPGVSYRFVAPGMTPSPLFALSDAPEEGLEVRGGSWARYVTGVVLTVLGTVYIPVGTGLVVGQEAVGTDKSRALLPLGGTLLGIGVVSLAIGIPLWLGNRTTITRGSASGSGIALTPLGLTF
jgi:hypothetical protein